MARLRPSTGAEQSYRPAFQEHREDVLDCLHVFDPDAAGLVRKVAQPLVPAVGGTNRLDQEPSRLRPTEWRSSKGLQPDVDDRVDR